MWTPTSFKNLKGEVTTESEARKIRSEFLATLKKDPCHKVLGTGASGTNIKVCKNHETCEKCIAIKVGTGVSDAEVRMVRDVDYAVKLTKTGRYFEDHLLRFVAARVLAKFPPSDPVNENTLATQYREKATTFRSVLSLAQQGRTAKMGITQFSYILLATFLSLHFLHKTLGLVHMDLKSDNILLIPWPSERGNDKLATTHHMYTIPKQEYWPIVIDFGNSYDGKKPYNAVYDDEPWDGKCYLPLFDVFRLLYELRNDYVNGLTDDAQMFLEELYKKTFKGKLSTIENSVIEQYYMMDKRGCEAAKKLPAKTYADVITKSKMFEPFKTPSK